VDNHRFSTLPTELDDVGDCAVALAKRTATDLDDDSFTSELFVGVQIRSGHLITAFKTSK
jgi:hypothetical protein